MSRALVVCYSQADRRKAADWCMKAPSGTRIEFKAARRSLDQNSRMWAMLTDVATQVQWHGVKLRPDDWKLIFLDALRREIGAELRLIPNLDGDGFVNIGNSSSDLDKAEMTALIELIFQFGANPAHPVKFGDEDESEAAA